MTREEKINLLNELLEYEEKNDIGHLTRAERREFQQWISEALEQETVSKEVYDHEYFLRKEFELKIDKLQRQLKALEQEPVLDKIRAEIVALKSHHINDGYDDGFQGCRTNVLHILDKYKAESEG